MKSLWVAYAVIIALFTYCTMPSFSEYIETVKVDNAQPVAQASEWRTVESSYFTIYFRADADLRRIERYLRERWFDFGGGPASDHATLENKIAHELDALFTRTKQILDMEPRAVRLKIKIYEDREGLGDEYARIFGTRQEYKAFYVHKYKTIYTSEEDISDSVISHEMAHAIIDNYFSIIPPQKVSEVLASYVDMHLSDD